MTKEDAIKELFSNSSYARFMAAHELSKVANQEDLPLLLRARQLEHDAYVLKRIEAAIAMSGSIESNSELEAFVNDVEDDDLSVSARARATEWIAGLLLHEIGSKLGLVALAASNEVPLYETSDTNRHIKNLQAIFDAIGQLKSATIQPRLEQFDLFELIEEVVCLEKEGKIDDVSLVGIRPLVITGCRHLVRLALCNGIRNAIEAVGGQAQGEETGNEPLVLVNWGITDKENWISIIDHGPGLAGSPHSSFEIGKTTKGDHTGFGLAIAKQALETIGGEVSLNASSGGGAKYEMRWKRSI
jgi:signal transduction histidine kinase